ncbi:hypothetical protein Ga0100230_004310 [Opitutaceae bacterium TAV3]|nr:hypothetical protein Ga0100230_004310 [Opitutaceae bacterium TAV3]
MLKEDRPQFAVVDEDEVHVDEPDFSSVDTVESAADGLEPVTEVGAGEGGGGLRPSRVVAPAPVEPLENSGANFAARMRAPYETGSAGTDALLNYFPEGEERDLMREYYRRGMSPAQRREELVLANADFAERAKAGGAKVSRDPTTGLLRQETDAEGRPVFVESKWAKAEGKSGFVSRRNARGEIEERQAPVRFDGRKGAADPYLYFDYGNGQVERAGHVDDLAEGPDETLAATAKKWQAARQRAIVATGGKVLRDAESVAKLAVVEARQEMADLHARQAALQGEIAAIPSDVVNETEGGVLGIGAKPTARAAEAQAKRRALEEQVAKLSESAAVLQAATESKAGAEGNLVKAQRAAELERQAYDLSMRKGELASASAKRAEYLRSQGKDPEKDQAYLDIRAKEEEFGVGLSAVAQEREALARARRERIAAEKASMADGREKLSVGERLRKLDEERTGLAADSGALAEEVSAFRERQQSGGFGSADEERAEVARLNGRRSELLARWSAFSGAAEVFDADVKGASKDAEKKMEAAKGLAERGRELYEGKVSESRRRELESDAAVVEAARAHGFLTGDSQKSDALYAKLAGGGVVVNPDVRRQGKEGWGRALDTAVAKGDLPEAAAEVMSRRFGVEDKLARAALEDRVRENGVFQQWLAGKHPELAKSNGFWSGFFNESNSAEITAPPHDPRLKAAVDEWLGENPGAGRTMANALHEGWAAFANTALYSPLKFVGELSNAAANMFREHKVTVEKNPLYALGSDWASDLERGRDSRLEGSVSGLIGGGAGSALGFLAPTGLIGKAGKALGLGAKGLKWLQGLSIVGLGGASEADAMFEEARAYGWSQEDAILLAPLGMAIGATELLPVMKWADRLTGKARSTALRRFTREIVEETLENTGQEFFQQMSSNAVARAFYDKHRDLFEGVGDSMIGAGGSAPIISALTQIVSGVRLRRVIRGQNDALGALRAMRETLTSNYDAVAASPDMAGAVGLAGSVPGVVEAREEHAQADAEAQAAQENGDPEKIADANERLIAAERALVKVAMGQANRLAQAQAAEKEIATMPDYTAAKPGKDGVPVPVNVDSGTGRDAARAILKVAGGAPLSSLTAQEQKAVRAVEKLEFSDDTGTVPMFREVDGGVVVTDRAREWLQARASRAAELVGMGEVEQAGRAKARAEAAASRKEAGGAKPTSSAVEGNSVSYRDADGKARRVAIPQGARLSTGGEVNSTTSAAQWLAETGVAGVKDVEFHGADGTRGGGREASGAGDDGSLAGRLERAINASAETGPLARVSPAGRRRAAERVVSALEGAAKEYASAFTGGVVVHDEGVGSGGVVMQGDGELHVYLGDLAAPANLSAAVASPERIKRLMQEEAIHAVAARLFPFGSEGGRQIVEIWQGLGEKVQAAVREAYVRDGAPAPSDWQLGHEFLRMVVQGRFGGEISEATVPRGVLEKIRAVLDRIAGYFRDTAARLRADGAQAEAAAAMEGAANRVEGRMREMLSIGRESKPSSSQSGSGTVAGEVVAAESGNRADGSHSSGDTGNGVAPPASGQRDADRQPAPVGDGRAMDESGAADARKEADLGTPSDDGAGRSGQPDRGDTGYQSGVGDFPSTPDSLEGEKIDKEWTAFSPESGSLNIPRAEMPQIKAEARGALVQFLRGRGIRHAEGKVLPGTLKPTQAEYSQGKVDKARKHEGGDRAILVSSDRHVLDGHHQWMAALTDRPDEPMRIIMLGAPMRDLLALTGEFPSAGVAGGAKDLAESPDPAPGQLALFGNAGEGQTGPRSRVVVNGEGRVAPASRELLAKELGVEVAQIGNAEKVTHKGREYWVINLVIDAATANTSHDASGAVNEGYPPELQPRNRADRFYRQQQARIAGRPNLDEESKTGSPDSGPPVMAVVDGRAVTVIGNGRANAKALMYAEPDFAEAAAGYPAAVEGVAARRGIGAEGVRAAARPTLARLIVSPMSMQELREVSKESNEFSGAQTNAVEQAAADADALTPEVLANYDPEFGLMAAKNAAFRSEFVEAAFGVQGANLTEREVERRLQLALFAKAYGGTAEGQAAFLRLAGESEDSAKNITQALFALAPAFARMKQGIADGALHPLDISGDVARAAQDIGNALRDRPKGQSVDAALEGLVGQREMDLSGGEEEGSLSRDLTRFLVDNRRSRTAIEAGLRAYVDGVWAEGDPRQESLFGGGEAPSREGVWRRAVESAGELRSASAGDVHAAASRFRPRQAVQFTRPLAGPSGARLVAYEWQWKPEEYVDRAGEDRVRRVSDWERAAANSETGRDIVHQFTVEMPDGEARTVSAETVPGLLGFGSMKASGRLPSLVSAAKTLAKLQMQLAVAEAREANNERIYAEVEKMPLPPVEDAGQWLNTGQQKLRMGDYEVAYRHDTYGDPHLQNKERQSRIQTLTLGWREKRREELGYKSVYSGGPNELRRRIQRAQKKVDEILAQDAAGGNELRSAPAPSLDEVRRKWGALGIQSSIAERNNVITLSKIRVPSDNQGAGIGTAAMRELLSYADAYGKIIALTPSADFGASSVSRLKEFYGRFGFFENKGSQRDFEISESMIRLPGILRSAPAGDGLTGDEGSVNDPGDGSAHSTSDALTGVRSFITGGRVSAAQALRIARRVRQASIRPSQSDTGGAQSVDSSGPPRVGGFGADSSIRGASGLTLRKDAGGAEAFVYFDRKNSTVYKVFTRGSSGSVGQRFVLSNIGGVMRDTGTQKDVYEKAWVINALGGAPTEVLGRLDTGEILTKQPLGSIVATWDAADVNRRARLVEIPASVLPRPQGSGEIFYANVDGHDFLVGDLHAGNYVGDTLARGRIADLVTHRLAGDDFEKAPALREWVAANRERARAPGGELFSAPTGKPAQESDDERAIRELMDALGEDIDWQEVDRNQTRAQAEAGTSKKTVGRPDLANPAESEEGRGVVNAVDAARMEEAERESHEQWREQAVALLANDHEGVKRRLLEQAQAPDFHGFGTAVDVKAAQILVNESVQTAMVGGDAKALREAQILTWAYREAGTETARAMAARRDPFKSPEERHREFLASVLFRPTAKARAEIEAAPTAAEKSRMISRLERELADARKTGNPELVAKLTAELGRVRQSLDKAELLVKSNAARMAKIEKAFEKMGVTLADVFGGEVYLRLRGAKALENFAETLDAQRKRAFRLIRNGRTWSEVAEATGLSTEEVGRVFEDFRADFIRKNLAKFEAGMKATDVDVAVLASGAAEGEGAAKKVSREEAIAEMEKALAMMGLAKNQQELNARRKKYIRPPVSRRRPAVHGKAERPDGGDVSAPGRTPDYPADATGRPRVDLGNRQLDLGESGRELPPGAEAPETGGRRGQLENDAADSLRGPGNAQYPATGGRRGELENDAADATRGPGEVSFPADAMGRARGDFGNRQLELGEDAEAIPPPIDLSDAVTAVKLARAMEAADGNAFDMAFEYWVNSILSGPQTSVANVTGNALNAALDMTLQRGVEAMLNAGLSVIGRGDASAPQLGEFSWMMRGIAPGVSRAWARALKAFDAEAAMFENDVLNRQISMDLGKVEAPRAAISGKLGRVVRIPGRMLLFQDEFFKGLIGQMQAGAEAYRIAKREGLSGEGMERRIQGLVNLPGSEAWVRAVAKARDLTFQNDFDENTYVGRVGQAVQGFRQKWPGMRYIIPFLRTVLNIFATGARKSPLGLANMAGRFVQGGFYRIGKSGLMEGRPYERPEMIKHAAEQLIAWSLLLVIAGAAEGDDDDDEKTLLITGSRPYNPAKRGVAELEARTGQSAYTVRIGDRQVAYGRYEPLSTMLGLTVDMIKAVKQRNRRDGAAMYGTMARAISENVTSKTFAQGLGDLQKIVSDPERALTDWGANFAASWVPNIARQVARNADGKVRETSIEAEPGKLGARFVEGVVKRVAPMVAEQKVDVWGRPMNKAGNALSRQVVPGAAGEIPSAMQRVDRMLLKWNAAHPDEAYAPASAWRRVRLSDGSHYYMSDSEQKEFRERSGKAAAQILAGIPLNMSNPSERDIEKVKNAFSLARKRVRLQMFAGKRVDNDAD